MLTFFIILGVVGLISLIVGLSIDSYRSNLDFVLVVSGLVAILAGGIGSAITAAYRSDVNRCENVIPQISEKETKWLDGECYVKSDNGKFVPLRWVEEGYDD